LGFDALDNWVPAPEPWTNQNLPDPELPNSVIAPFWKDLELFYTEPPTNTGVSTATNGPNMILVEYDDIQPYGGSATEHYDFEVVMLRTPVAGSGEYEIVFAYDNIVGTVDDVTVGLENASGTEAALYAYNEANSITDGFNVCFDYVGPDPVYITYQVTVDNPAVAAEYTNIVEHDTDAPGTVVETTSHTVTIDNQPPTITKTVSPESISNYGDTVTYTISLANSNIYPITSVTMTDTLPPMLTFEGWVDQPAGATFTAPDMIEWAGTIPAEGTVDFVFTASTPMDTHSILIDIVNTAYMGYPGGSDSSSVSFSLIRKIYLPLVMRAYTTP
jgi:uncharacterized repeat protein (TIGR01451 family)